MKTMRNKINDLREKHQKNIVNKDLLNFEKIYHYTNPESMNSILIEHQLRFSDIKFLNDETEIN